MGGSSNQGQGKQQKRSPWTRQGGASSDVVCQKCLEKGHWTYQCKNEAAYRTRPSRTKELLRRTKKKSFLDPSEVPQEFRSPTELYNLERERKEHEQRERKRNRSPGPQRTSDSESSLSSTSKSMSSSRSYSTRSNSSYDTSSSPSSSYSRDGSSSEYTTSSRSQKSYSR